MNKNTKQQRENSTAFSPTTSRQRVPLIVTLSSSSSSDEETENSGEMEQFGIAELESEGFEMDKRVHPSPPRIALDDTDSKNEEEEKSPVDEDSQDSISVSEDRAVIRETPSPPPAKVASNLRLYRWQRPPKAAPTNESPKVDTTSAENNAYLRPYSPVFFRISEKQTICCLLCGAMEARANMELHLTYHLGGAKLYKCKSCHQGTPTKELLDQSHIESIVPFHRPNPICTNGTKENLLKFLVAAHEIADESELESRLFAATILMKCPAIEAVQAGIRALHDANRRRKFSFDGDESGREEGAATPASVQEDPGGCGISSEDPGGRGISADLGEISAEVPGASGSSADLGGISAENSDGSGITAQGLGGISMEYPGGSGSLADDAEVDAEGLDAVDGLRTQDYRINTNLLDLLHTSSDEISAAAAEAPTSAMSPNESLRVEKAPPLAPSPDAAPKEIFPSYSESSAISNKIFVTRPGPATTPPLVRLASTKPTVSSVTPKRPSSTAKALVQSHFETLPSPAKIPRNDRSPQDPAKPWVPTALVFLPGAGTRPWNPDASKDAPVPAEKVNHDLIPLICAKCVQEVWPHDEKSLKKHVDGHLTETSCYKCARCPSRLKTKKSMEKHLIGPHKIDSTAVSNFRMNGFNVLGVDFFDVRGEIFVELWTECFPDKLLSKTNLYAEGAVVRGRVQCRRCQDDVFNCLESIDFHCQKHCLDAISSSSGESPPEGRLIFQCRLCAGVLVVSLQEVDDHLKTDHGVKLDRVEGRDYTVTMNCKAIDQNLLAEMKAECFGTNVPLPQLAPPKYTCHQCGHEFEAKNRPGMHNHAWHHVQLDQPGLFPFACKHPGCHVAWNYAAQIVKHVKDAHGIAKPIPNVDYEKRNPPVFQEMYAKCFPELHSAGKNSADAGRFTPLSLVESEDDALSAGNNEIEAEEIHQSGSRWIQCGRCLKWRQLRNEAKTSNVDDVNWVDYMDPNGACNCCAVPLPDERFDVDEMDDSRLTMESSDIGGYDDDILETE